MSIIELIKIFLFLLKIGVYFVTKKERRQFIRMLQQLKQEHREFESNRIRQDICLELSRKKEEVVSLESNVALDYDRASNLNKAQQQYMVKFFEWCNMVYIARKNKTLNDDVWRDWLEYMQLKMQSQVYVGSWRTMAFMYNFKGFWQFVERNLISKEPLPIDIV